MPAIPLRNLSKPILLGLLALVAGTAACSDDDDLLFEPEETDFSGTYEAETLVFTEDGTTSDILAAGGQLTLTLNADGTATGDLFVPGGNADGSDIDESLTGTWIFDDVEDTISLELDNNVFLDQVVMSVTTSGGNATELEAGDALPQGGTFNVVLVQRL